MEINNQIHEFVEELQLTYGSELIINKPALDHDLTLANNAYDGLGIKILSIVGGALATLFFLGFAALTGSNSAGTLFMYAALSMGLAIFLDRRKDSAFFDAACIGAYLSSYLLLGFAAVQLWHNGNLITGLFLVIAIATPFVSAGYMLNFFAVLILNGCLFSFIEINSAEQWVHVLVAFTGTLFTALSLFEAQLLAMTGAINVRYSPVKNGFLFAFIAVLTCFALNYFWNAHPANPWISSIIIITAVVFSLLKIIQFNGITAIKSQALIFLPALLILLPVLFAPSICGALLIILISVHTSYKVGFFSGVIALIYFTGQYYYDLQFTLLEKSLSMLVTGMLFIAAWVIFKQLKKNA